MKSINSVDKIVFNILKYSPVALIPSRIHYLVKIVEYKEVQMERPLSLTWFQRGTFYFSEEVTISIDKLLEYHLIKRHYVRTLSNGNTQYSYESLDVVLPLSRDINSLLQSFLSRKYYTCKLSKLSNLMKTLI
jgi:hypothetical protein